MKNIISISAFLIIVCFISCKNNEARINELNMTLQGVSDTIQICTNETSYTLAKIDSLKNQIQQTESQIETDSLQMKNYFSEHKMAVACMSAGYASAKVKLDFDTDYPEMVEEIANWGVVISLVYYIFNKDEVDTVSDNAERASNRKKELYANIDTYYNNILEENNHLNELTNWQNQYKDKAVALRNEIAQL